VDVALSLVEIRNRLGMSRTSFAKSVGSSQTQMKRYETGIAVPKEKLINRICEEYHVNPAYFKGEISIDEAITGLNAEDEKKNAGKRLKQIRLEMNMTLKEFSALVQLSNVQLCQIEIGNSPLTVKRANDIWYL
jgi:transcriptional regulator with XRE-family HTH domain